MTPDGAPATAVEVHWIPLGAGAHVVRLSGRVFEALSARVRHRPACDLYHAALVVTVPDGRYVVEQTPVPAGDPARRGVVASGPVGSRALGRCRVFRYEIRRWRDGTIPDLDAAVASVRATSSETVARRVLAVLPEVPTPTWGRDELHAGEMWNSNSVVAWSLARAGVDLALIGLPEGGRAPGWHAGWLVATRPDAGLPARPAGRAARSSPRGRAGTRS